MKKIIYLIFLIPVLALGQSQDQNYVKSTTYKIPTSVIIPSPALNQAVENITYFDGLGRPIQQVEKGQSATGKNIITPTEYDAYGRQVKEYLPYASQNTGLNYEPAALTEVLNYPEYQGQNPWNEKLFEPSPLNRILKRSAPGSSWAMGSGKEIKLTYQTNTQDEVKIYSATATWNSALALYDIVLTDAGTAFYASGQLYKTTTKDENDNTTQEFKDKDGHVVLKRSFLDQPVDTYYVHDQYGNLTYVIPPSVTNLPMELDGHCYQYKYDYRNRLVEKKLPGKQWEFIIYDRLDRIVARGPAYSPFSNFTAPNNIGWLVTKYDAFDRIAYTGWMQTEIITSTERKNIQEERNSQVSNLSETKIASATNTTVNGIDFRYTNVAWPSGSGYHVLSVNYYDDYNYPNAPTVFDDVEGEPVYYKHTVSPKGMPTGKWNRVPQTSSQNAAEVSYDMYDSKGRTIRSKTVNHLGGHTTIDSKLDFSGKVLYTITRHARTGTESLYVKDVYSYSDQGRLLTHTHQIGTAGIPQLLSKNEYDELGRLVVKRVGGTDLTGNFPLQKIDYSYNVRGWLKEINNTSNLSISGEPTDLFAFKLNYDTVENNSNNQVSALYNGSISEAFWRTNSDDHLRSYGYRYDALSRLTNSIYRKNTLTTNAYNENIRYGISGNIQGIERTGDSDSQTVPLGIDQLEYTYNDDKPNLLIKIFDSSNSPVGFDDDSDGIEDQDNDYAYDDNGNMTTDQNKGITAITYNHLNLPTKIVFGSESKKIQYLYNAEGKKVQKAVTAIEATGVVTSTYNYFQGFQYKGKTLLFFPTSEGYVAYTPATSSGGLGDPQTDILESFNYVYNYTDNTGNIRLSYGVDPATQLVKIIEENHYYPFGLKHTKYNTDWNIFERNDEGVKLKPGTVKPLDYKFKYNGKEFQDELGLNMYDYGARNYDPAIARWTTPDPLLNDLDFTFNPDDVDTDDEEDLASALQTSLANGEGIYNTNNLNPYGYGYNNPVSFDDPDGRCPVCIFIVAALLVSQSADAPTGNKKTDTKTRNATAGNNTLIPELIMGGGAGGIIGNASRANSIRRTIEKGSEKKADIKKVPNPNGKKGGAAHQKVVKEQEVKLKNEGYVTKQEVMVKTPKGEKTKRYIDVEGKHPETGATKQIQVGKKNQNGTPVAREKRALDDIEAETGKRPTFVPYN